MELLEDVVRVAGLIVVSDLLGLGGLTTEGVEGQDCEEGRVVVFVQSERGFLP